MPKLKKRTWRLIYSVTAVLTPTICMPVFLRELAKCENILQLLSLYILEIAVCLLFLPSYKHHYQRPFFIGWLLSLCSVMLLIINAGAWDPLGVTMTLGVPLIPLLGLMLEPLVSKLKYHLPARALLVGLLVLVRFLL